MTDLPVDWRWSSVGEVARVDSGPAFQSKLFGGPDGGTRLLRGDNIEPGALRWQRTRTWPDERLSGFESLLVEVGDIILAMDRPVISSGLKLGRVTPHDLPALLVQRVARIRATDGRLLGATYVGAVGGATLGARFERDTRVRASRPGRPGRPTGC